MPIITPSELAAAKENAGRIQKAYKLKQTEDRIEALLAGQRQTEQTYLDTAEAINAATDRVNEAKAAVVERENELLNEAMGDALMAGQEVERLNAAIATRENEILQAIKDEVMPDPKNAEASVPRYMTSTGQKTEHANRKKVDETLIKLKADLKEAKAKSTEPKSAADRNRLLATIAGTDDTLKILKGQLANEEAALVDVKLAANKARVEYNAMNREYNSLLRLIELKAATMRALVGFELETPPLDVQVAAAPVAPQA